MSDNTSIEWVRGEDGSKGASWNPIRALNRETGRVGWYCEHATPGCENCYSEAMNHRLGTGVDYKRQNRDKVELFLDEKILNEPLGWQRPRKIFVESMSDLFADFVPVEWIDRIFGVMEQCSHHTFLVLTKRGPRMRDYFREQNECIWSPASPPKWIWAGVSVEDQERADERLPLLLDTPAAVRWMSLEPMLGPVDLFNVGEDTGFRFNVLCKKEGIGYRGQGLDWVIVGGESGPRARPMELRWVHDIVSQCQAAQVPVFVKQIGSKPVVGGQPYTYYTGAPIDERPKDRKGGSPAEWPSGLRVREYPAVERA